MKKLFFGLSVLLISISCYHSTGIEEPVSIVAKIDNSNYEDYIAKSPHAMAAIGDYYVSNTKFAMVVDGGIVGERKQNFLAPTGGSIVDLDIIYDIDSLGNKSSANNDYINQIFQVLNYNVDLPVAYTSIQVSDLTEDSATILLKGYPMDNAGIFKEAGITVDADTKLVKSISVETTYHFEKSDTYLTMTTIVKNNNSVSVPVTTVGDYYYLGGNSLRTFVPVPGLGYTPEKGTNSPVYTPFISFNEAKSQFAWIFYEVYNPDDGMLMVTLGDSTGEYNKAGNKFATVNKPALKEGLQAGEAITFTRYLEPKLSDLIHTPLKLIPEDLRIDNEHPLKLFKDLGTLTGTIVNGNQGENMVVIAEQIEPGYYYNGDEIVKSGVPVPVAATRVSSAGGFTLDLPAGIYQLRIQGNNIDNKVIRTYVYKNGGDDLEDPDDDFEETRPITIEKDKYLDIGDVVFNDVLADSVKVTTTDAATDEVVPARVIVTVDGKLHKAFYDEESGERGSLWNYFLYYGSRYVPLSEGTYGLILTRGPEYPLYKEDVSITSSTDDDGIVSVASSPETVEYAFTKSIDREGYLSFDPVIRTDHSYNSSIIPADMFMSALTEGLDVIMSDDINKICDFYDIYGLLESKYNNENSDEITMDRERLRLIYGVTAKSFYPGDKYPKTGFGEFSVFPVESVKGVKGFGVGETGYRTFATVFDLINRQTPDRTKYSMLLRPRGTDTTPNGIIQGLFTSLGMGIPASLTNSFFEMMSELGTGTTNNDFELIEVLSGNAYDEYLMVRQDWFNILREGYKKFAAAGSGYNYVSPQFAGSPRTYVHYTEETFDEDNFLKEFASGHSFISTGPYLTASVNGQLPGSEVTKTDGKISVTVKVQAPDWIPVDELRVVVNGEVVKTIDLSSSTGVVRFSDTLEVNVPDEPNSFVLVECGASLDKIASGVFPTGDFALVYPGIQPIAFTNPFFVN